MRKNSSRPILYINKKYICLATREESYPSCLAYCSNTFRCFRCNCVSTGFRLVVYLGIIEVKATRSSIVVDRNNVLPKACQRHIVNRRWCTRFGIDTERWPCRTWRPFKLAFKVLREQICEEASRLPGVKGKQRIRCLANRTFDQSRPLASWKELLHRR